MKSSRKLLVSVFALVITLAMATTSTFAWFSMNTTVTAAGMQVTAKSNNLFLQIINSTGAFSNTESQNSASAVAGAKSIFPTTVGSAVSESAVTELVGTEGKSALKWATAYSDQPNVAAKSGDYTDVSTSANADGETNNYTLINLFKVRLNPATGVSEASNLKVANVQIVAVNEEANSMLTAVRLLVVSTDGVVVFKQDGTIESGATDAIIAGTVTTTATDVYAYIFFEGSDSTVITNNLITSEGYNVSFDLIVDTP